MTKHAQLSAEDTVEKIIGVSAPMKHVFEMARKAARSCSAVLVQGELGTGKAQIAAAIHMLSKRAEKPFVRYCCSSMEKHQQEHCLFGSTDEPGLVAAADEGTLFLDEVDRLSMRSQTLLLEVLENERVKRRPDHVATPLDVRVIAASNHDLSKQVADGVFREDLYWKLDVLPIALPPLRRRREDIEPLVRHYLEVFGTANGKKVDEVHPEALASLVAYQWPGNIRELQNYIERAVVMADSQELTPDLLPARVMGDRKDVEEAVFRPTDEKSLVHEFVYNRLRKAPDDADDLYKQIVEPIEKELLVQILDSCNHTQTKAAQRLGINRNTLYKKLKEYGLEKSSPKSASEE
jgi:DNA-binding NtrC family response regulator